MTRHPIQLLAILALVIVGACSSGAAPSPSPVGLDGHTYLSTKIAGAVLVPDTRVRLVFAGGNLSASGGCNTMSGTYAIVGDRLTTNQMSMTEMACEDPRMAQDDWLAGFLGNVTYALAGDTLTLTSGDITLTLLDSEVATPDKPIEGTRWILEGIIAGDTVSSVPNGVTASIRIMAGQVEVEAGCNTGGGSVQVTTDALIFGGIGLTKRGCEAGPAAVESAVIAVLSGAVAYSINADVLNINAANAGLIFRAAPTR